MKIRLVVALVGLAISFAPPAFSQQKDTVDPQLAEQLSALGKKTDEAFNTGDAAALAALYTEEAVSVNEHRSDLRSGGHRETLADVFKQVQFSNPYLLGAAWFQVCSIVGLWQRDRF
jgi:hypothetical protein